MKLPELGKLVGAMWRDMDDKARAKFTAKAAVDKERYAVQMAAYAKLPGVGVVSKPKAAKPIQAAAKPLKSAKPAAAKPAAAGKRVAAKPAKAVKTAASKQAKKKDTKSKKKK